MDLVYHEKHFFPRISEDLSSLPLDKLNCTISKYIIEKFFIVNSNYITRTEEYPFLTLNSTKKQNISNEYLLKIHKSYELSGEYFCFQRKKINFLIFMNKNEQKIKDLNSLLFYLFSHNTNEEDSISVTIIMCSYTYLTEFKANCIFHDKPYYFFTDYCTQNKLEYEKFTKFKIPKFKVLNLNMYDVTSLNILIDLDIKPIFLPQFFIYDRNYKVLYKDNLFQETPTQFQNICNQIYTLISQPYRSNSTLYLGTQNPIKITTFFDKLEKEINNDSCFKSEEEFQQIRSMLLDKCLKQEKTQKRGKTCKMYFVKKVQNLNYDLSLSAISKTIYLQPFIYQSSNYILPDFLYGSNYLKFPKLFHNAQNEYLNYTLKCALSYITNTNIKCDMTFNTKKRISNITQAENREFNVEYHESFDIYYVPLNFKILFKDKSKYFSVNLYPKLNPEETFKILFKDIHDIDKEFIIKDNEITILQYFMEDLYVYQFDLGEKLNSFKLAFPNVKFKYCIVILIPCEKFKNSIHADSITAFLNSCQHVDEILIFTYVFNEFKQLTKYLTNGPFIYIFDQKKQMCSFEVFPGDRKRIEEWFYATLTRLLNPNKWRFDISKSQYKQLKVLSKEIMSINEHNSEKELIVVNLNKIKSFDIIKKPTKYQIEVMKANDDVNLKDRLLVIQNRIISIIGKEAEIVKVI